jgi:hypothetical protein
MFSDIREDGMAYENSSGSDSNDDGSTSLHENLFFQSSSASTANIHNINMSKSTPSQAAASGSTIETSLSNVADRVWKVLDFMSTANIDLTGFLDALSWGESG